MGGIPYITINMSENNRVMSFRRFLILLMSLLVAEHASAQLHLTPTPNLLKNSFKRSHVQAVYSSLLPENNFEFAVLIEYCYSPQCIIVCTAGDELIYRRSREYIYKRRARSLSEDVLPVSHADVEVLRELMETAVLTASYNDYYEPDDDLSCYYMTRRGDAMHHFPWPDYPIGNPNRNNVKELWNILSDITDAVLTHDSSRLAPVITAARELTMMFSRESDDGVAARSF